MALEPIRQLAGLKHVVITTLQAVSGTGKPGIEELERQEAEIARGEAPTLGVYKAPIAYNAVPLCESFRDDGYSTEEVKLLNETRKIFGETHSGGDIEVTMDLRARARFRWATRPRCWSRPRRTRRRQSETREVLDAFPGRARSIDDTASQRLPDRRPRWPGSDEVRVGRVRKRPRPASKHLRSGRSRTTCARAPRRTPCRSPRPLIERGLL